MRTEDLLWDIDPSGGEEAATMVTCRGTFEAHVLGPAAYAPPNVEAR